MSNITNQPVKFIACTDVQYQNLANKENNAIYFVAGSNNDYRICLGGTCYNVTVVNNLLTPNYYDVPTTYAVSHELSNKVNRPFIHTYSDASLPSSITPTTDHEYRYVNLLYSSGTPVPTPTLEVCILTEQIGYFYTSLILHGIYFSGNTSNFITVPNTTGFVSNIRFLNDADLTGKDTVEILLFSNGIDICCISAAYDSTSNSPL